MLMIYIFLFPTLNKLILIEVNIMTILVNGFIQDEENMHKNEVTQVDTDNLGEDEKTMLHYILDLMKHNSRIEL